MAFVVQRELFDSLVADPEVVEFIRQVPLAVTARTRDRRRVVDGVDGRDVSRPGVASIVVVWHGQWYDAQRLGVVGWRRGQ